MIIDTHEHNILTIALLDNKTGKTQTVCGPSLWDWTDGNWSCDCNRAMYFDYMEVDVDDGMCAGESRFWVTKVDPMPDGYTLDDFNDGYDPKVR